MQYSLVTRAFAFNLLSAKQISTVPNLQRHDVDVQTTLQRCVKRAYEIGALDVLTFTFTLTVKAQLVI